MGDLGKKPEQGLPAPSPTAGGAQPGCLLFVLADGCGQASQQQAGGAEPRNRKMEWRWEHGGGAGRRRGARAEARSASAVVLP